MKCETAALQNKNELDDFVEVLRRERVASYLEVGAKFGGSFWRIGTAAMPKGARMVALDLPHGDTSFKQSLPALQECIAALNARDFDARLIVGDSTDRQCIEQVYALGPFDACLIDANHTLSYVTQDWENYRKICKLIAFHDINFYRPRPLPPHKKPIEVPQFWQSIKDKYRHIEIKHDKQDNGIGVIWL